MKLYATTTSERASKGQGGNEYIEIELKQGSREVNFTEYIIEYNEKGLIVMDSDGNDLITTGDRYIGDTKGKKPERQ